MRPFHEKVKARLDELGRSQEWVAERMDVSQPLVSRWVRGKNKPDVEQAFRLARLLGLSLDYLADDAQDEPPHGESMDPDLRLLLEAARHITYKKALDRILNYGVIRAEREFVDPRERDRERNGGRARN